MLGEKLILILEDDAYVALDLAGAVEDANGCVSGPAASVGEAMDLLDGQPIAAAILDVQTSGGDVTSLAQRLRPLGLSFVVQSATGLPVKLMELGLGLRVLIKPLQPRAIVAALLVEIEATRQLTSSRDLVPAAAVAV
ncbi:MAG TPA: hypothetical protein VEZ48_12480 [Sphingomonadaceae bacterium]|nr:hypothetical protein [Sphingomonadaceae bacterium]